MFVCSLQAQAPAAPQVTVSGVSYLQYLYQLKDTAGHQNNFDVTRAYINVVGKFSGGVGTRITGDIQRVGAGDNSLRYRLKYAYVTYQPSGSALTYKFGLMQTPYVDWAEALWDYRMQGPIALDRNGYLTSSDFGIGADGNWNHDQVNGQIAFVNGEGYGGGAGDKRKDLEARVSVRLANTDDASRVGGLRLTGYAGIGKATGGADRNRYLGNLSYRSKQFTLAGELTSTKDAVTGRVISTFGVFHPATSKAAVIARIDLVDPDVNVANNKLTRYIAGVSYQLSPNLRLLGDIDWLSYEATPTPAQEATRSQALFQAQFTF
jgi:hypothetical protein